LHPLWFKYPQDENTFTLEYQFFFGDSILVSPVTGDDATSVSIYLPQDVFYDFNTFSAVKGAGSFVMLSDIPFTKIPLYIKGGAVLPLRAQSAMTTTALRKKDFEFIVAPDIQGEASGSLYIDDGESINPASFTNVNLRFKDGKLEISGVFGYKPSGVNISLVRFLNVSSQPEGVLVDGKHIDGSGYSYNPLTKVLDVEIGVPFVKSSSVQYL
jgi:alpha-glucosidase